MNEHCICQSDSANVDTCSATATSTRLEDLNLRIEEICNLANMVETSYDQALVRNLGVMAQEISKEVDNSGLINLMLTRMNYVEQVLKEVYLYLERV